ncbi:hypothetical protein [Dyella telluris]|uniref:Phage tail assembly protein n=1 Tax=Dyella telluris TaxID=2763498 RepID=A0A7G8Q4F6_9GAMM|nr:hypothetical protein [Dyella telluris]QNK01664.1 hypothetical protein H8F01_00340 [Dyella telluris]
MTRLINLDELAAPRRVVTLKGTEYEIQEFDLESFVDIQAKADELFEAQEVGDNAKVARLAKVIISNALPDMPGELVGKLTMRQMYAVVNLIFDAFPSDEGDKGNDAAPAAEAEPTQQAEPTP